MYRAVRSLERGLEILQALSQANGASVTKLSAMTRIHRTTVYRLLDTLHTQGFVVRSASQDCYRLAQKVRSLADGLDDDIWIGEKAAPVLRKLVVEQLWPSDLATYANGRMTVRDSTHRFSPYSILPRMVGRRWPMLSSSLGKAFLAFSDDEAREDIVADLRRVGELNADSGAMIGSIVSHTRERGYALSVCESHPSLATIALPIRLQGQIVGALNMVFFASAFKPSETVDQYLPALRSAVADIEADQPCVVH
jgi:IclR family transcriptional regulator, mhp operon transcriptional activator